ncbi:unnamed protein product [Rhizophagus irregularis]|nr:unnamed protein product [Rhizophagus irregularis]
MELRPKKLQVSLREKKRLIQRVFKLFVNLRYHCLKLAQCNDCQLSKGLMSSSNSNLWTSMIDEGISVIKVIRYFGFVVKETYKMSTITISGMLIRLWCLIRGNSSAFKVAIGNKMISMT